MWLLLFAALIVLVGSQGARALLGARGGASPPFERASTTALVSLGVALALSWGLALPRLLTRGSLLGGALVLAAAAVWLGHRPGAWREARAQAVAFRARVRAWLRRTMDVEAATLLAIGLGWSALGLWVAFALWRGATVFSPNHDGVAYHLPEGRGG